ncbi:MAG: sigma-70 family RNA polymerase sigma factor [Terrimesophilobacter sp.]
MDQQERAATTVSDESLILSARAGDRSAFAELWNRHAPSGVTVARQFTSSLDADDLVAEAYTRIYQRILDGGGPYGAFRPYLYTTIRNLASRWGGARKDIQIEDIDDLEDENLAEDATIDALDKSLTVRAFRSLPERWQSVLWYTEVEGMDPHEVAPILGITANSVAALSYRAREGLRKAWLQAHVTAAGRTEDCKWAINRLGDNSRRSLTAREQTKLDEHLAGCLSCSIVAEEVDDVGSRLALVVLPLLLGGTAGGTLLASLGAPASASAASMPPAFQTVSLSTGHATGVGFGAAAMLSKPILIGSLAVFLAVGGGVAAKFQPHSPAEHSHANAVSAVAPLADPGADIYPSDSTGDGLRPTSPQDTTVSTTTADRVSGPVNGVTDPVSGLVSSITDPVSGLVKSVTDPVSGLVSSITDPISAIVPSLPIGPVLDQVAPDGVVGAVVNLDLNGKGMPRATVSAQVAGNVYTTVVANDGTWALRLSALPEGVGTITVKQRLTVLGISVPITIPLTLLSDTLGLTVELLN